MNCAERVYNEKRIFIFLLLMMLITGCMTDGFPDESNGDSVNTGDEAGENPYFFRKILS